MIGQIVRTTTGRIGRIIQIDLQQPSHYLVEFDGYRQWLLADTCQPYIDFLKDYQAS
ncbi:MAG: hypothetical protein MH252_08320 [Thermosynechococcaceae cyanobacterium MS004]|nr:hypothetical protein [Thermosynechococcaceae cyanobacterium MS004]